MKKILVVNSNYYKSISKNLIEDTLKCSSEKLESDEEYAKQIYSIINPALSYTHWQDKTLSPEQQFIKSEQLKDLSQIPSKDQKYLQGGFAKMSRKWPKTAENG